MKSIVLFVPLVLERVLPQNEHNETRKIQKFTKNIHFFLYILQLLTHIFRENENEYSTFRAIIMKKGCRICRPGSQKPNGTKKRVYPGRTYRVKKKGNDDENCRTRCPLGNVNNARPAIICPIERV